MALGFAESVKVEWPVAVTGFGLNMAVTPLGRPEILNVTELLPPTAVAVTVTELLDFRRTAIVPDDVEREKSRAALIVNETDVVWVPPLPEMVSENVPVGDLPPTLVAMVKVDMAEPFVGGVTEAGLSVHFVFAGHPLTVRSTALLNPLTEVTVMVDGTELPCVTVTDDGFAESEKSGAGALPQPVNLKDPM